MQAISDQLVVTWTRLMHYHYWEFTCEAWDRQTRRGQLCLTEQPWLSKALVLQSMAERPHLHRAHVDQCQFDLHDPKTNQPMRKRTVLDVNSAVFAHYLESGARCQHEPQEHQVIEGATMVDGK
jgi:hypothetical protein